MKEDENTCPGYDDPFTRQPYKQTVDTCSKIITEFSYHTYTRKRDLHLSGNNIKE